MKKIILTLILVGISNVSFANGFSPWDTRSVAPDTVDTLTTVKNQTIGFAPWEERVNNNAFANESGIAMEIHTHNIFRPWS